MSATTHDGLRLAPRVRERARVLSLPRPELAALLVLAGGAEPVGAVAQRLGERLLRGRRALDGVVSWHAFLFGSLDPAGVMTVDKPPLALWVQALSVRVFGLHSLSMLVPQALMGVASVGARL